MQACANQSGSYTTKSKNPLNSSSYLEHAQLLEKLMKPQVSDTYHQYGIFHVFLPKNNILITKNMVNLLIYEEYG